MRKTVKNQIMKKPLFALALIAFGIGIAIYTNASFKEGNETMGDTTTTTATTTDKTKKTTTDSASSTSAPSTSAPSTSAPSTSASSTSVMPSTADIQAVINSDAVQKLLGSNGLTSVVDSFMNLKKEPMGVMTQPRM